MFGKHRLSSQVVDCIADSLAITKERKPLTALDKFSNSGRVRMSYCEAASTSTSATQPQPPLAMLKMASKQPQQNKQPKAIGRSNSFTFDFVRPQVFKSVCHELIYYVLGFETMNELS